MATIKSYTDLEQSKKLAEILPLESADMVLLHEEPYETSDSIFNGLHQALCVSFNKYNKSWRQKYKNISYFPCWSLAALLDVLPKKYYPIKDHETYLILGKPKDKWCVLYWDATGMQNGEQTLEDNPVDACVDMILTLHELNLL